MKILADFHQHLLIFRLRDEAREQLKFLFVSIEISVYLRFLFLFPQLFVSIQNRNPQMRERLKVFLNIGSLVLLIVQLFLRSYIQ